MTVTFIKTSFPFRTILSLENPHDNSYKFYICRAVVRTGATGAYATTEIL